MFASKHFLLTALLVGVNSRYVGYKTPYHYTIDSSDIIEDDAEDALSEQHFESARPGYLNNIRVRRQLRGLFNTNPDGSSNLNAKLPLAGNDNNRLSALGSLSGLKNGGGYGSVGGGLALENVNGHALSVTGKHIPAFGDQLTAAAKVNLLHNDHHDVNANAFITRNMPNLPNVPNFNQKGGSIDYTFNNKVGASLGMSHTDLLKRTDYSAMGNMNLFRDRQSSLDLNAGYSKSVSPFTPNSSWQPSAGLSFTRFW